MARGMMAAFFRATLLNDPDGYDWIHNTDAAPIRIWIESK